MRGREGGEGGGSEGGGGSVRVGGGGFSAGHAQVPSSCPTQATSSIFDEEMEAALHSICAEDESISVFFS